MYTVHRTGRHLLFSTFKIKSSLFQVQILMEVQQIKANEKLFGKSNYMWLCSKKVTMLYMSTKDEFRLRQALNKVIMYFVSDILTTHIFIAENIYYTSI